MDLNDIAQGIRAVKGYGLIKLGFWLNKKPDKTEVEALAAKAFLKTFWGTIGLVMLLIVVLFLLTGYVMAGTSSGYEGEYEESRYGRVENGQIRYVKNELYYIAPEEIGLLSEDLPEGTRITLYFDKNDQVIAGINADEVNREMESRVVLLFIAIGIAIILLIAFAVVAKKTFGKPWYCWLRSIRGN